MSDGATEVYPLNSQHRCWLQRALKQLQEGKGLGFRDRCGDIVLVTPSAKSQGQWQATWFRQGGPYRDQLSADAKLLLLQLAPGLREWLMGDALERAVKSRVQCC